MVGIADPVPSLNKAQAAKKVGVQSAILREVARLGRDRPNLRAGA
jgi:hypothetical protein